MSASHKLHSEKQIDNFLEELTDKQLIKLQETLRKKVNERLSISIGKELTKKLYLVKNFISCGVTYNKGESEERAVTTIGFSEGIVKIDISISFDGEDRDSKIITSFGNASYEGGIQWGNTERKMNKLNFNGWTFKDTRKLLETVINTTMPVYHDHFDFVFEKDWVGEKKAKTQALADSHEVQEASKELQRTTQTIYQNMCEEVNKTGPDDYEGWISYVRDISIKYEIYNNLERCIVEFYNDNNEEPVLWRSYAWNREHYAFPDEEMINGSYDSLSRFIKLLMPVCGERLIEITKLIHKRDYPHAHRREYEE